MSDKPVLIPSISTNVPDEISTSNRGGHKIRTGKKIVDRHRLHEIVQDPSKPKQPNTFTGHTFKNKVEKYRLDGQKLMYHRDRVNAWLKGERIAPVTLDMGLSKFCNAACTFCIGVTQGGFEKGKMIERDALMRFLEDCGRLEVKSIAFIGDGEPTMNPALYDAVVHAKKNNIDIGIGTNGMDLDMSRAHDLLRDSIYIRFNLSAGTPKGFQRIHQCRPEQFTALIEKIRSLVKIRNENNYPCTIGLQMVLIPENFEEIMPLTEVGLDVGVDYLQIKQCSDTEYKELGINPQDYARAHETLRKAETFTTEDYLVKVKWNKIDILGDTENYKGGFRTYDICYGTPFLGQISGNGKVFPCGPHFEKDRFYMGNINKESYYDIVMSDKYWEVHNDIKKNVDVHCDCTIGCRQDYINKYLWDLMNPPDHTNFI